MIISRYIFLALGLSLQVATVLASDLNFTEVNIEVGERTVLDFPPHSNLNVSRRGVIDVQLYSDQIAVTGLKKGSVMLTFSFRDAIENNQKVFVTVANKKLDSKSTLNLDQVFLLKSRVLLLKSNKAKRHGIESNGQVPLPNRSSLGLRFHDKDIRQDAELLATPEILITLGHKTEIKSGFEDYIVEGSGTRFPRVVWKEWGLKLGAKLLKRSAQYLWVTFEFSLSNPSGERRSYSQGYMQSTAKLRIRRDKVVGKTHLFLKSDQETGLSLLGKVPIIGPLFKDYAHTETKKEVLLEFNISPIDA